MIATVIDVTRSHYLDLVGETAGAFVRAATFVSELFALSTVIQAGGHVLFKHDATL